MGETAYHKDYCWSPYQELRLIVTEDYYLEHVLAGEASVISRPLQASCPHKMGVLRQQCYGIIQVNCSFYLLGK